MPDKIFAVIIQCSAMPSLLARGTESVDIWRVLLRVLTVLAACLFACRRKTGSRVIRAELAPGTVADDQFVGDVKSVSTAQVNIADASVKAHC